MNLILNLVVIGCFLSLSYSYQVSPRLFSHVGIYVSDIKRSEIFYNNTFGMAKISEELIFPQDNHRILTGLDKNIEFKSAEIMHLSALNKVGATLIQLNGAPPPPKITTTANYLSFHHLSFLCSNIEDHVKTVKSNGGWILSYATNLYSKNQDKPYQVAYVTDPDQNIIQLISHHYDLIKLNISIYDYKYILNGGELFIYPTIFSHIGLVVPDIEKALTFYRQVFGLSIITNVTEYNVDTNNDMESRIYSQTYKFSKVIKSVLLSSAQGIGLELIQLVESKKEPISPDRYDRGIPYIGFMDPYLDSTANRALKYGATNSEKYHGQNSFSYMVIEDEWKNKIFLNNCSFEWGWMKMMPVA